MQKKAQKILVTGAAGFIGFHLSQLLLQKGYQVAGLDNLDPYYSVQLKKDRVQILKEWDGFQFIQGSLADQKTVDSTFRRYVPEYVVHLAAQAGVRHSIDHPLDYVNSNLVGFVHILEACRHFSVQHLVFASSSSVYGLNTQMPFSVNQNVDHPISLYAATKKSNELMAHSYSYLYGLPTTGLRFFTVYGPWGRPDMALFRFTKAILNGTPIDIYNQGNMKRDFTYVADSVECVRRILLRQPQGNTDWKGNEPDPGTSPAPYRIFNIGNGTPVQLMDFITCLENSLGVSATYNFLPMQPGDVPATHADSSALFNLINFRPNTSVADGIEKFVNWYRDYYQC